MKAVRWTGYGEPEVLILDKLNKPIPKDNEMLKKIMRRLLLLVT